MNRLIDLIDQHNENPITKKQKVCRVKERPFYYIDFTFGSLQEGNVKIQPNPEVDKQIKVQPYFTT